MIICDKCGKLIKDGQVSSLSILGQPRLFDMCGVCWKQYGQMREQMRRDLEGFVAEKMKSFFDNWKADLYEPTPEQIAEINQMRKLSLMKMDVKEVLKTIVK